MESVAVTTAENLSVLCVYVHLWHLYTLLMDASLAKHSLVTLNCRCPLHWLFESAVRTICATEDNMIDCKCDNGVMESLHAYSMLVILFDQTGVGCYDPSLKHYVLWKFTNTLSPLSFVIFCGYFYSLDQNGACMYYMTTSLSFTCHP